MNSIPNSTPICDIASGIASTPAPTMVLRRLMTLEMKEAWPTEPERSCLPLLRERLRDGQNDILGATASSYRFARDGGRFMRSRSSSCPYAIAGATNTWPGRVGGPETLPQVRSYSPISPVAGNEFGLIRWILRQGWYKLMRVRKGHKRDSGRVLWNEWLG